MSMIAFISGASGFCGRNLIRYLIETKTVNTDSQTPVIKALSLCEACDELIRSSTDKPQLVEIVRGDITDAVRLVPYMRDCTVVFHLAAKASLWGQWEEFFETNVVGTANMLEAANMAKVPRFVHFSSMAVHLTGLNNGCLYDIDEDAPLSLDPPFWAPYTKSKAMAEKLVLEGNSDTTNTIAIRPSFVWGKGDTTFLPGLVGFAASSKMKWLTPFTTNSWTHVENVCEGAVLAAQKGRPGQCYFLTDGEPMLLKDFCSRYLEAIDIHLNKVETIPSWLMWRMAAVIEHIPFAGFGKTRAAPFCRQGLGLLGQSVILQDKKARRELGYTAHMTVDEGLKRMSS